MARSDANGPRALCLGCGSGRWAVVAVCGIGERRLETTGAGPRFIHPRHGCAQEACRPSAPVGGPMPLAFGGWVLGRGGTRARWGPWLRILHCGCWLVVLLRMAHSIVARHVFVSV